ncbi:hypothetical protein [Dysosmobacter welbionis]|jgi:hypothetical protein|uniref:DUF551 domain-containing protein n=1 Tax=Dysosmobacter welbionis TaxID=2093857 RepID=A0A4D7AND7_9FIRM|nr:hypothetical protein [Dysosmobacter welbionis]QCI59113.1 hypothetical protein EIO64_07675 [Dysosmobacter welbionis]QCI60688.1 hypothetical protein EIO64_16970 [Dysosmobacter welbionis]DAV97611.1 MAG TPA: hypothetical protein [Caudoviricetes sp.]
MEEFDCKKCLHEKVCALWASRESQNASCFCTDGCDYFTPTLTPPNEPLTLEELREMDEPVWVACKPIEGGNGYWCLCQHGHIITPAGSIYNVKEIPHWVFYRRPPEGEDET